MSNTLHRPPVSEFEIRELMKLERFEEADEACQKNIEFYESRADHYRVLGGFAAAAQYGIKSIEQLDKLKLK